VYIDKNIIVLKQKKQQK